MVAEVVSKETMPPEVPSADCCRMAGEPMEEEEDWLRSWVGLSKPEGKDEGVEGVAGVVGVRSDKEPK